MSGIKKCLCCLMEINHEFTYVKIKDGGCPECHQKLTSLIEEDKSEVKSEAIKSDGGKSDYYEVTVNGHTFMIEDMIQQVFGNDFDRGNILKALVRVNALIKGGGKEGSSVKYETNKMKYYAGQIEKHNE